MLLKNLGNYIVWKENIIVSYIVNQLIFLLMSLNILNVIFILSHEIVLWSYAMFLIFMSR